MNIKNLEFKKVEDFFKKEVKINPNNAEANFNLARVYKENGDYQKARFFYEKTIKIQPKNFSAYNNLANIYKHFHISINYHLLPKRSKFYLFFGKHDNKKCWGILWKCSI